VQYYIFGGVGWHCTYESFWIRLTWETVLGRHTGGVRVVCDAHSIGSIMIGSSSRIIHIVIERRNG